MNVLKNHLIYIDSSQRTAGTSSDFVISLKQPLILSNPNNFYRCRCIKAVIPHVINQINSTNRRLYYIINNVEYFFDIEEGNYNINNLLDELKYHLGLNAVLIANNTTYDFKYNKVSGKASLKINNNNNLTVLLKFSLNKVLATMFGFDDNDITLSNVATESNKHVNVNPITYLLIRSSSLSQRESYENIIEKDVYSDVLTKVYLNNAPGTFIFLESGSEFIDITNRSIDTINIYLSTNLNYDVNIQGLNWSCVLEIQEIGNSLKENTLNDFQQPLMNVSKNPINEEQVKNLEDERQNIISKLERIKTKLENQT